MRSPDMILALNAHMIGGRAVFTFDGAHMLVLEGVSRLADLADDIFVI